MGLLGLLACLRADAASAIETNPLPRGHAFFQTDFERSDALQNWNGSGRLQTAPGASQVLLVEREADEKSGAAIVRLPLDAEAMRGYLVRGSAKVRAEGVSIPPQPWNGIKCMLAVETPDRKLWPQAEVGTGSFDWRRVGFTTRVPTNASAATLVLGLEQVTGRVWFDDVSLTVARAPVRRPSVAPSGPPFTGHALPRLRGAMVSPGIDAASLAVLGRDWNANLIRWQLIRHGRPGQPSSLEEYDAWLEGELKKLDAALPVCEAHGILVVLDLHSPPGGKATVSGYVGSDDRLFTDPVCQEKFVKVWQYLATRYRAARPIWGYDLANEPVQDFVEDGCDDWQALAERAARAIRAVDAVRTIIVEPASWGGADGLNDLVPLSVSNVVYSVHMYVPHAFTHQGVHAKGPAYRYPGVIEGRSWDRSQLEAALQPVIDFQRAYGVHIYIGEFSAIRWAPGDSAFRYLSDLIGIFEAHGWDWSYHAFREWSGWSVEHSSDRNDTRPATEPTDRQRLLQQWFRTNQKPLW